MRTSGLGEYRRRSRYSRNVGTLCDWSAQNGRRGRVLLRGDTSSAILARKAEDSTADCMIGGEGKWDDAPDARHDSPGKIIVKYFLTIFTIESRYDFRD